MLRFSGSLLCTLSTWINCLFSNSLLLFYNFPAFWIKSTSWLLKCCHLVMMYGIEIHKAKEFWHTNCILLIHILLEIRDLRKPNPSSKPAWDFTFFKLIYGFVIFILIKKMEECCTTKWGRPCFWGQGNANIWSLSVILLQQSTPVEGCRHVHPSPRYLPPLTQTGSNISM